MSNNMLDNSDADFDAYWEDEARNPNRNRIRIGRQYQATIPPLIKPGESDGRKLEDLETLKWRPQNSVPDLDLDQYLSVAKAVYLITRLLNEQSSQNITSNTTPSEESNTTTESSKETNSSSVQDQNDARDCKNDDKCGENIDNAQKKPKDSEWDDSIEYLRIALKGLSEIILSPKEQNHQSESKVPLMSEQPLKAPSNQYVLNLPKGKWTMTDIHLFTVALEFCGKNFSAIKKEFLPWKSINSIIEFYYFGLPKKGPNSSEQTSKSSSRQSNMDSKFLENDSSSCEGDQSRHHLNSSPKENDEPNSSFSAGNHGGSVSNVKNEPNDDIEKGFPIVNGLEVVALKGRPVSPQTRTDTGNNVSNLGSLKFYKDGHLVLKLNAKQEDPAQKCHWVESQDTPKLTKQTPHFKGTCSKSESSSGSNHRSNHLRDDNDDNSVESSDVESQESSESNFQTIINPNNIKKAKVRVEDCFVPSSPCNTLSVSASSSKDHLSSSVSAKGSTMSSTSTVTQDSSSFTSSLSTKRPALDSSTLKANARLIEGDMKKRSRTTSSASSLWPSDKRALSSGTITGSLGSKWFMKVDEKLPPAAHAASRHGIGSKISSSMTVNTHTPTVSSTKPVDLTSRKSLTDVKTCPNSPPNSNTSKSQIHLLSSSSSTTSPSTTSTSTSHQTSSGLTPNEKVNRLPNYSINRYKNARGELNCH